MNEIITAGPLKFSEPNCPTRVGEIVEKIEDIYSIPTPRLGMMVFVKNKGRHYTITSLKSAVIGGVEVPNAQVDTFEPVAIENVGNVDSLDGFTDNGIYQGYHVVSGEVFVLVVINNHAVAAQMGVPTISQFKYSVNMGGRVSFEQRTKDSVWGEWCKVNEPWIVSQLEEIERNLFDYINKCIKDVTDGIDPEKIDSLKDLIAWVEEHGGTVNALWESIEENAGRITSETKRAKQAEEELSDAIRLNYEDIKSLNTNKAERSDAMQYNTLGVNTYANKAEIYGRSISGTPRVFDFPAATTTKAGVMSAYDKNNLSTINIELFPQIMTPNFEGSDSVASGTFNSWWGFSTSEDNISGLLVAIDFGYAPTNNKTWQYRLGKKVRDASGTITGLTTVQGSEGTITIHTGETRAYLNRPIEFKKDYVLELYFGTVNQDENIYYKSQAATGRYVRFTNGVAKTGSMYAINAVIQPETSIISELQNEVKELSSEITYNSRNLFDRSKVTNGYVNSVDGVIMSSSAYPKAVASPVIDVEPNTYYTISGRTDTKGIVGYDSNGNRVQIFEGSWSTPDYNGTFLIPSNVVKVQFSCVLNHEFSETDLIQFEKGEVATPYVEFGSKSIN
jgi:uncharacterized protein YoxC